MYTNEHGIYRYRETWEMTDQEETKVDENVFACTKCNCKFKTMSSLKYHYSSSHTPTGREFLNAVESFFSLD